ncbi:hypothetical protein CCAX7_26520 [Capsulimonas corticalis]|uniref:Uncharacterized protein n=1 Tax=Capsulimonas corticalis TaxID=2219043 RepID=A0A402D6N0_9BACT|nr:STAS domain-containing protein [Capsulimonas corticalis]BDI30601.1 hypothetical protein CCAX7_26520 [Capsulimonas corticalis]
MPTAKKSVAYRRRGAVGALTLHGAIDMFEAAAFHETARKALEDTQAAAIRVEMSDVERLDISSFQILSALRRDAAAAGRTVEITGATDRVLMDAKTAGLSL